MTEPPHGQSTWTFWVDGRRAAAASGMYLFMYYVCMYVYVLEQNIKYPLIKSVILVFYLNLIFQNSF